MAQVRITHEVNVGSINVLLNSPYGGIARDMYRRGQNVRTAAVGYVESDTGRLATSLHVELVRSQGRTGSRVGSPVEYALDVERGHGEIRPTRGKFLIFSVRGRWVFARKVRPVPGQHYLQRALPAARG